MAVCKKCGSPLPKGAHVCPECKAKVFDFSDILTLFTRSEDYTDAYSRKDIHENKVMALLCYIPFVCLFPIIAKSRRSAFVRFHANQGLVIFGIHIIISILVALMFLIWMIPIAGPIFCVISGIIFSIIDLANLAAMVFGIIFAASGKARELPIIGGIRLF